MNITETTLADVATVWEVTPTSDSEEYSRLIEVPPGTEMLTFALGDIDQRSYTVPSHVRAMVTLIESRPDAPPDESRIMATSADDGRLVGLVVRKPKAGKWRLIVKQDARENFSVVVGVFTKPLKALGNLWGKYRCKACTVAVKAAIMALLAELTGGAVGLFDLGDLLQKITDTTTAVLDAIAELLGTTGSNLLDWLKQAMAGILDEIDTPLDTLARLICRKLGLCLD